MHYTFIASGFFVFLPFPSLSTRLRLLLHSRAQRCGILQVIGTDLTLEDTCVAQP